MDDSYFMQEALKEARKALEHDEVPVGAVITLDNRIIAKAHNQVETLKDPTAHAEMIAITQAANTLSSKWLYDCCLYVTLEPCSMCAGAMVLARIKKLFLGALDPKTGSCGSVFNVIGDQRLNHAIELSQGLLAQESSELLKNFFKQKRVATEEQKDHGRNPSKRF